MQEFRHGISQKEQKEGNKCKNTVNNAITSCILINIYGIISSAGAKVSAEILLSHTYVSTAWLPIFFGLPTKQMYGGKNQRRT